MSELPAISGAEAVSAFCKAGFVEDRRRGSHVILKKAGHPYVLSVPQHRELKPGTLRRLIRDAGMTKVEFCELL